MFLIQRPDPGRIAGGCTKETELPEPYLSIDEEPAAFGSDGGSAVLNFKTNRPWSIAPDTIPAEEWCRVTPPSGEGGEELSVTISADPNQGYIARNLTLVLRSGTLEKRIPITQMKKNVILLDGDYRARFHCKENRLPQPPSPPRPELEQAGRHVVLARGYGNMQRPGQPVGTGQDRFKPQQAIFRLHAGQVG